MATAANRASTSPIHDPAEWENPSGVEITARTTITN
jgi:hypothetical protein